MFAFISFIIAFAFAFAVYAVNKPVKEDRYTGYFVANKTSEAAATKKATGIKATYITQSDEEWFAELKAKNAKLREEAEREAYRAMAQSRANCRELATNYFDR